MSALSLAYPHLLAVLVVVPIVWWVHRMRRRPRTVDLPSLLFLEAELEVKPARRRGLDLELLVALLAAALLAIAAAGPRVSRSPGGHRVRVVISGGASAGQRGYRERVAAALVALRAELASVDELEVVEEPAPDAIGAPRPTPGALLRVAQAGQASWRVVISDRRAPPAAADLGVTWFAVGESDASNTGLVAASLTPAGAGFDVFANVQSSSPRARRLLLELKQGEGSNARATLDLEAGLARTSHVFSVSQLGLVCELALHDADGSPLGDDLAVDDRVVWEKRPVRIAWGDGLTDAYRSATEQGLLATLGRDAFRTVRRDPDLIVVAADDPDAKAGPPDAWTLCLHPVALDRPALVAGVGPDRVRQDPLVADLSTGGVDLRYAPGAETAPEGATVLLARASEEVSWPVVAREGRTVHFLPDLLQGRPSPARSAFWPLFVANLLDVAVGTSDPDAWGFRRRGLLDAESSRLGTTRTELVPRDLSTRAPDVPPTWLRLSPWLAGLALALLALLWLVRWPSRRGSRRRARPATRRPRTSSGSPRQVASP